MTAIAAPIRRGASAAAPWLATILGLTIPVSVAADHIVMVLFLVAWLLSGRVTPVADAIRHNPVAGAATLLMGLLLLGGLWGPGTTGDFTHYLGKNKVLIFVALWLPWFVAPAWRRRALVALMMMIGVMLVMSYASALGIIERLGPNRGPGNPTVFKNQITHNYLMAFGAFLFVVEALQPRLPPWRVAAWSVAAVLALVNVLVMVKGRTGYVVLAMLAAYLVAGRLRWRGRVAVLLTVVLAVGVLFQTATTFRARIDEAVLEARAWRPGEDPGVTSIGQRLNFYYTTLALIRERPWLGTGTGGFPAAYEEKIHGTPVPSSNNPHNQYLLYTAQLGVGGLVAFLALLVVTWRAAVRLPTQRERDIARGLVLAMATGCLFNSMLMDHTEGIFFCWLLAVLFGGYPRRLSADALEPVGPRVP